MDAQAHVSSFMSSAHGSQAREALSALGISPETAETYLTHATQAGVDHVEQHASSSGVLGDHAGKSFFAAFGAGLLRGDGVLGALKDGAGGVLGGRIAEAIAQKTGIDPATAATVAAAASPYVLAFLNEHLRG